MAATAASSASSRICSCDRRPTRRFARPPRAADPRPASSPSSPPPPSSSTDSPPPLSTDPALCPAPPHPPRTDDGVTCDCGVLLLPLSPSEAGVRPATADGDAAPAAVVTAASTGRRAPLLPPPLTGVLAGTLLTSDAAMSSAAAVAAAGSVGGCVMATAVPIISAPASSAIVFLLLMVPGTGYRVRCCNRPAGHAAMLQRALSRVCCLTNVEAIHSWHRKRMAKSPNNLSTHVLPVVYNWYALPVLYFKDACRAGHQCSVVTSASGRSDGFSGCRSNGDKIVTNDDNDTDCRQAQ